VIATRQSIIYFKKLSTQKKDYSRGLNRKWTEPDVRDNIVDFTKMITSKTDISLKTILGRLGIRTSKYYSWQTRYEQPNNHNGKTPKKHWLLNWERKAIIKYSKSHLDEKVIED